MFLVYQSSKTPTSVLTDRAGKFLAFGYEAEQKYSQALEDEDSDDEESSKPDMLLFRHFKMMLHKQVFLLFGSMVYLLYGLCLESDLTRSLGRLPVTDLILRQDPIRSITKKYPYNT